MSPLADLPIPPSLLAESRACRFLRGRVREADRRLAVVLDGCVVGFVTPHETAWGWRLGPIFLAEAARGRGLLAAVYEDFRDRSLVAFVADDNAASRVTHERAGFSPWRRGNGGWFLRREAS